MFHGKNGAFTDSYFIPYFVCIRPQNLFYCKKKKKDNLLNETFVFCFRFFILPINEPILQLLLTRVHSPPQVMSWEGPEHSKRLMQSKDLSHLSWTKMRFVSLSSLSLMRVPIVM